MWLDDAEVVRTGSWLYDGSAPGRVRILKMRGDRASISLEEAEELQIAPTDVDGFYYVAEYTLPSLGERNNGSLSSGHASIEGAVLEAESKLPAPIHWVTEDR